MRQRGAILWNRDLRERSTSDISHRLKSAPPAIRHLVTVGGLQPARDFFRTLVTGSSKRFLTPFASPRSPPLRRFPTPPAATLPPALPYPRWFPRIEIPLPNPGRAILREDPFV